MPTLAAAQRCGWDVGHTPNGLRQAIWDARHTAVAVIAAGNWSLDNDQYRNWPASYCEDPDMTHAISVMATDEHDRAGFVFELWETQRVAAPGFVAVDAAPSSSTLHEFGSLRDRFRVFRGTSAATAHVARLVALEWPGKS